MVLKNYGDEFLTCKFIKKAHEAKNNKDNLAKGISDRSALDAASKSSLFKSVLIASAPIEEELK